MQISEMLVKLWENGIIQRGIGILLPIYIQIRVADHIDDDHRIRFPFQRTVLLRKQPGTQAPVRPAHHTPLVFRVKESQCDPLV